MFRLAREFLELAQRYPSPLKILGQMETDTPEITEIILTPLAWQMMFFKTTNGVLMCFEDSHIKSMKYIVPLSPLPLYSALFIC